MFTIDTSTSLGSRVAKRLADELIFWLTTVGRSGAPHPNPVWFLWTGSEILVFSQRGKVNGAGSRPIRTSRRTSMRPTPAATSA
jgi:Pyridoxamine 5'-phosphate oxidase